VTYLDLFILLLAVFAAVGGYQLGFLARGGAWLGLVVGVVISIQLVGPVVGLFDGSDEVVRLFVAISVVAGLALIGQSIGLVAGDRLGRSLPKRFRPVDKAGGALAGVIGVLVVVWLLLPTLGVIPGEIAQAARSSAIVGLVDEVAPPPPASLHELSQRVSDFEFPQVFDDMRAAPVTGPPPSQIPVPVEVQGQVALSTMNIEAIGCGGIQEGSGFVVEPELVATNAHVVAGTEELEVVLDDGSHLAGTVVAFDDGRDLALVHVPGLERPPLALQVASEGQQVAVFGYPGGQDNLRIAPATVSSRQTAIGRDIYGQGVATREILILAADLRPGDSGSAVVNPQGQVVGVAFAIAPDRSSTAYALTEAELADVLAFSRQPTSTGSCR
jgi:S1-C subfamily serine protease